MMEHTMFAPCMLNAAGCRDEKGLRLAKSYAQNKRMVTVSSLQPNEILSRQLRNAFTLDGNRAERNYSQTACCISDRRKSQTSKPRFHSPSLARLPCVDEDSMLPAVARCDATIDGFDAIES